jgi:hypothetical protein
VYRKWMMGNPKKEHGAAKVRDKILTRECTICQPARSQLSIIPYLLYREVIIDRCFEVQKSVFVFLANTNPVRASPQIVARPL